MVFQQFQCQNTFKYKGFPHIRQRVAMVKIIEFSMVFQQFQCQNTFKYKGFRHIRQRVVMVKIIEFSMVFQHFRRRNTFKYKGILHLRRKVSLAGAVCNLARPDRARRVIRNAEFTITRKIW